jgi:hypothetical protein
MRDHLSVEGMGLKPAEFGTKDPYEDHGHVGGRGDKGIAMVPPRNLVRYRRRRTFYEANNLLSVDEHKIEHHNRHIVRGKRSIGESLK